MTDLCTIPRADLEKLVELASVGAHSPAKATANTREQLIRSRAFIAAERALDRPSAPPVAAE